MSAHVYQKWWGTTSNRQERHKHSVLTKAQELTEPRIGIILWLTLWIDRFVIWFFETISYR